MHEHSIDLHNLLWFCGWVIAVAVLFVLALRLPLQTRLRPTAAKLYAAAIVVTAIGVTALANVAVSLHDVYFDLTRESVFTPSASALQVVDRLQQPVKLTYFYQGDDPNGRRAADMAEVMGRRNSLLQVHTVDPDEEPSLAKSAGISLYNAAMLEAGGRKVIVNTTDEAEIAIGIQRVLRERIVTACFMEGHKEYPMDAFEFHTHFESGTGHAHDDASSAVVQTQGHGVGRLRRVLEGLGYDAEAIQPAIDGSIPQSCSVLINAGPRTTYLPEETRAIERYLAQGGSLLLLYDLGFVLEPGLEQLLARLGIRLPQAVLIDPQSHYGKDPETLAVTAYDPHPITRNVSLTFFPGARPLQLGPAADGITTTPLVVSSPQSYTMPVAPLAQRAVEAPTVADSAPARRASDEGSRPVAAIVEGQLTADAAHPFRAAVIGDADFASNSFFPYMANSDLALALIRWLVREERSAAIASRIPVPTLVLLTRTQARNLFIVLEVLIPLAVMLTGVIVWWRRR